MSKHRKKSRQVQVQQINGFAKVQNIALDKLVRSEKNVRNTNSHEFVEELSHDILRRGLLQPLIVELPAGDNQEAAGCYEVIAGGRRLRALQILLERKLVSVDLPVPCIIRDASIGILAEDDSFAENVQRVSLHPVDQFHAFMAMKEKGMSEAEIAAAYFVSELVVKQRVRLAQVAPEILAEYREDRLTLDQVIAFTVNADHARQRAVLEYINTAPYSYLRMPEKIRDMLTETKVKISDARARFVGEENYKAAGGSITTDLFADKDDTYFDDPALLDRLVAEKLEAEAEKIRAEGWKWVVPLYERYNPHRNELRRLVGTFAELSVEEQAAYQKIHSERDRVQDEYDELEDWDEELEKRLDRLNEKLHAYEQREPVYSSEDKQKAGAFIYVDTNGALKIDCGYIAAEDEEALIETESADSDYQIAKEAINGDVISEEISKPDEDFSDKLITNLTRHHTQAVRNKLAQYPNIALTLLLCRLVRSIHSAYGASNLDHVLQIALSDNALGYEIEDLKTAPYGQKIDERYGEWKDRLQGLDDEQLWNTIHGWADDERLALLAHCVSFGVNLVEGKVMAAANTQKRQQQKNILVNALQLDMRKEGWIPQADNYFSKLKKSQILDIVAEQKDASTARTISNFKKDAIAREAEHIVSKTNWLPTILCLENYNVTDIPVLSETDAVAETAMLVAAE